MTDTLKTVLVDALIEASDGFDMVSKATPDIVEFMIEEYDGPGREVIVHTDRLATAVRDHFLDREKVRSAIDAMFESAKSEGYWGSYDPREYLVDRLIAGLSGGSSE